MAQARRERANAGGPAGWMVLLGLMVLALIIAAASKGCGDSDPNPASQSPGANTSTSTGAATGIAVISEINATVTNGGGISFATGKTDLTAASKSTLDSVAALLAANPTVRAEIQGYTDNQGDAAKNRQLSQDRAEAVRTYLIGKNIAANRLTARGLGSANPIADNSTEAGRAKNRRIEFAIAP